MNDVEIIDESLPVPMDMDGFLEGTHPKDVKALLAEEQTLHESVVSFMQALKRISDGKLYRFRGYADMKSYVREYLGKRMPYSITFAQGLLSLANKATMDLNRIESNKIDVLVKIGSASDVSEISDEGLVILSDGTKITTEEYEMRAAKKIIAKADREVKESKKFLSDELSKVKNEKASIEKDLEDERKYIEKLKSEKEQTAKLIGIHGDRLSRLVNLTNAMSYLNTDCKTVESDVLEMVLNINSIGEELRSNPEVVEEVGRVFSVLRTACRRIINSWAPYNPDGFNFGVAYTEKSESEEPFISKIPVISESEPAVIEKPSNTEVSIAIRNIAEMYRSGASVEDRVSAIESLSAKLNQAQRSHIMDIVSLDKDSDAIEMLNDFASELEAISL